MLVYRYEQQININTREVHIMKESKRLYNEYNKLIDKLLFGVALTDNQMTNAAEEIVTFICKNNLTYLFDDIIVKSFYNDINCLKKKTKTQESVILPAGKIVKKLPQIEYVMSSGEAVTKHKSDDDFIKEIKGLDKKLIKTVKEVDWATLKKNITSDEEGNVMLKDTGECIESLSARKTLPSIKIETA
mgnify:CR=1 FL=1